MKSNSLNKDSVVIQDNSEIKIALNIRGGYEFIGLTEIIRCEASNNYTYFHLKNEQKILVSKTLLDFERILEPYSFFRVRQSHLVNLKMIKRFIRGDGGILMMSDGSTVEVSRRKKEEFMRAISAFVVR